MKAVLGILLLIHTVALCAPAPAIERIGLFKREHYRLENWAKANGFTAKRISKFDIQVGNKTTKLLFTVHSRKMSLNGITVWLSHPIAEKNGNAYITPTDVNTSISPVLWPPRNAPKKLVKHVCIDPGHGGKDPGNREGSRQEKKYALMLANELAADLRKAGFTVSFTRNYDAFIDLNLRPVIARRNKADLFISLHFNSAGRTTSTVRGAEVYCMTPPRTSSTNARGEGANSGAYTGNANNARNMLLAFQLQRALVRSGSEDRGVKRARFAVLRDAEMPSVLVEAGFMSHPAEAKQIYNAAWRGKISQAIVSGIQQYKKSVER